MKMSKKKVVGLVAVVLAVLGLMFGSETVEMVKNAVSGSEVAPITSDK